MKKETMRWLKNSYSQSSLKNGGHVLMLASLICLPTPFFASFYLKLCFNEKHLTLCNPRYIIIQHCSLDAGSHSTQLRYIIIQHCSLDAGSHSTQLRYIIIQHCSLDAGSHSTQLNLQAD